MKKLLFSTLIAVAAIGSATAFPVYDSDLVYVGDCITATPDPDCALGYGTFRDQNGDLYRYSELEGLDFEEAP